jgi:hypothetical protein
MSCLPFPLLFHAMISQKHGMILEFYAMFLENHGILLQNHGILFQNHAILSENHGMIMPNDPSPWQLQPNVKNLWIQIRGARPRSELHSCRASATYPPRRRQPCVPHQ